MNKQETAELKHNLLKPLQSNGYISYNDLQKYIESRIPVFDYRSLDSWDYENEIAMQHLARFKNDVSMLFDAEQDSDAITTLSLQFQQNGLTLPETSKQLKLNPKFISKIPFYICVLTWLYAIASLLK